MKHIYKYLATIFILLSGAIYSYSTDYYWVGGQGRWSDASHWSNNSGGQGGIGIPEASDNVFIDENSFLSPNQRIEISGNVSCNDFTWTSTGLNPILYGKRRADLNIYGSIILKDEIMNQYLGSINILSSSSSIIDIRTNLNSDITVTATTNSEITLQSNLTTTGAITLESGILSTNDYTVNTSEFFTNGNDVKTLYLGNSTFTIQNGWDTRDNTGFAFDAGTSTVVFLGNYPDDFQYENLLFSTFRTSNRRAISTGYYVDTIGCKGEITVYLPTPGTPNYKYILYDNSEQIIESSPVTSATSYTFDTLLPRAIFIVGVYQNGGTQLYEKKSIYVIDSLPPPLTATCSVEKDASCNAGLDFELRVDGTGGFGNYTYQWTSTPVAALGPPTDQQIQTNFLAEGLFTAQITDEKGCIISAGIRYSHFAPDYSGPDPIVISETSTITTPACDASATGTIAISATGGIAPLEYSIQTGGAAGYQADQTFYNLTPGTYEIWVQDANGCKTQGTDETVSTVPSPTANAGSGGTICPEETFSITTASVSNQESILWTIDGAGNGTFDDATSLTPIYTPGSVDIANGTVSLLLTAYGTSPCANATDNITITINPSPTAVISGGATICNGETTALNIDFTGTPPWNISYTNGTDTFNETTSDDPFNPLHGVAGTYTLSSLTDLNCTADPTDLTGSAIIIVNDPPTANAGTPVTICANETYNLPNATASNYQSLSWSIQDVGSDGSFNDNTLLNPTFTPGSADIARGSVRLRLTAVAFAPCVNATSDIVITITPIPTGTISGDATICEGSLTPIQIDFTGVGPWAYTYTDGTTPVSGTTSSDPFSFNTSNAATYTLTSISNGNCTGTYSGSATVVVNVAPTSFAGANAAICAGNTYTVSDASSTNEISYLWESVSPGADGTYSDNSILNPLYTPGANDISNGSVTLQLTVTGDAPCPAAVDQMELTINPLPTVTVSGDATICEGSSTNVTFDLTGSSPWVIDYTNGTTPGTIVTTTDPHQLSVSTAGNYTATAISDNNCTGTSLNGSANIIVNPAPTAYAGANDAVCAGDDYALSGALATGYASLSWDNGSGDGSFDNASALNPIYTPGANDISSGSVQLELTAIGVGSCPNAQSLMTLTINPLPTAQISGGGTVCAGSSTVVSIDLTGTAPWDIAYFDGTTTYNVVAASSPYNIDATVDGTYTVTSVRDANCTGTVLPGSALVVVTEPPTAFAGNASSICATENYTLSDATATNYASVLWSNGSGDGTFSNSSTVNPTYTPGPTDISIGSVELTLTAFGNIPCANEVSSVIITINQLPTATISGGGAICTGDNATIQIDLTGTAPWDITYTDGSNNYNVTAAATPYLISTSTAGTYSVTAISDANCTGTFFPGSVDVTVTPAPTVTVSGGETICEGTTTNIQFDFTGVAPWDLTYSDGTNSSSITTSDNPYILSTGTAGTYTATAISDAACSGTSFTGSADVIIQPAPIVTAGNSSAICFGTDYHVLDASVQNATGFSWSAPSGDGEFNDQSLIDPIYTPGANDKLNGSVVLRLTADGVAPCAQVFDEMTLNYAPELKVSIGAPSPFLIAASTDIRVCMTGLHDQVQDLGFYLNTPSGVEFELVPSSYDQGICNFGLNFDTLCFTTSAASTLDVCVPGPWPNPALTGDYLPTDSWSNLYGIDPAQGGWELEIRDYFAAYDGELIRAYIEFTDYNFSGILETVSYASPGDTSIAIPNPTLIGTYGYANYSVPMGLKVSCNGACDALAIVNPFGGTAPYVSYQWSDPTIPSNSIVNLCAGDYSVTVTDDMGCESSNSIHVSEPEPIETGMVITDIECKDASTGAVDLSAINGTGPYDFSWSNGETTEDLQNIPAGQYFVTVTDAKFCSVIDTAIVTEPAQAITLSFNVDSTSCVGTTDGAITVTANGGTLTSADYTYAWSTGADTSTISNLSAGRYYITVTDDNLCEKTDSIDVYSPAELVASIVGVTNLNCYGDTIGQIQASAAGGIPPYDFLWNDDNSTTSSTLANAVAGSYTLTVTDTKGCIDIVDTTLTQPEELIALIGAPAPYLISASTRIKIEFSGTHEQVQDLGFYLIAPDGSTVMELAPSQYAVGVCNFGQDFNTLSFSTDAASVLEICSPFPWPTPALTGDHMPTDAWSTIYGFNPAEGGWTVEIRDYFADYDGTLTDVSITFEDVNSEGATVILNHQSEVGLNLPIASPSTGLYASTTYGVPVGLSVSCNGFCDAQAIVTAIGGTEPYMTYTWSSPDIPNASSVELCGGEYFVTVSDANGCEAVTSVNVDEPAPILTAFDSVNVLCFGDSTGLATVVASDGAEPYSYEWSNGGTNDTISNIPAGIYSVIVTDNNNCPQYDTVEILQPERIVIDAIIDSTTCFENSDGSVAIVTSGGITPYSYLWQDTLGTDTLVNALPAGDYSVTITDGNLCEFDTIFAIYSPDTLIAIISDYANVSCGGYADGYAVVATNGGTLPYTIDWDGMGNNDTLENLGPGDYLATITDINGCSDTAMVSITEPLAITTSFSDTTHLVCMGDSSGSATVNATGGNPPYTYLWATNNQTDSVATRLSYGWQFVTVSDLMGCEKIDSVFINAPDTIKISFVIDSSIYCFGDSTAIVRAEVTGGTYPYAYNWSTGDTDSVVNNLSAHTYTLTITDFNACIDSANVDVTQPDRLEVASTGFTPTTCTGNIGTAYVDIIGGLEPYNYNWSTGSTNDTIYDLYVGIYDVTITDSNNCFVDTAVTVKDTSTLDIYITAPDTSVSCVGVEDGSAIVHVTGGTAPYNYLWTDGQTTFNATQLSAGEHDVTVTDINSCSQIASVTITTDEALTVNYTIKNISCNGLTDGSIQASASMGSPMYSYIWSNGENSSSIFNLSQGDYSVTIEDEAGCQVIDTITIIEPEVLTASIIDSNNIVCTGTCDGTAYIKVDSAAGTAPYFFSWSSGDTDSIATTLCEGINFVTITDDRGCTYMDSVTLIAPNPKLDVEFDTSFATCGQSDANIEANPQGGVPPYSYLWANGSSDSILSNISVDIYDITITDSLGCQHSNYFIIKDTSSLEIDNIALTHISCIDCAGEIEVTVSGGTPEYAYIWSNGDTTDIADSLCANSAYTLTVSDIDNCSRVIRDTITDEDKLLTQFTNIVPISCTDAANASVTASITSGTAPFSFVWSNGSTDSVASNLSAGWVYVTVTDARCTYTDSIEIENPEQLDVELAVSDANCYGESSGMITVNVLNSIVPQSYLWSNGQTNSTAVGLSAEKYLVTITYNDVCTIVDSATVDQPAMITYTLGSTIASCNTNDGSAFISSSSDFMPHSYTWNILGNTDSVLNANSNDTLYSIGVDYYFVEITDAGGCSITTDSVKVEDDSDLDISIENIDHISCIGRSDGRIEVRPSSTAGNFVYEWWSFDNGLIIADTVVTDTTGIAMNLPVGTYKLYVRNDDSCTAVALYQITEEDVLSSTFTDVQNASCNGLSNGYAEVTGINGTPRIAGSAYDYLWSIDSTTSRITNLSAAWYTVTVSDSTGCEVVDSIEITEPGELTVDFGGDSVATICYSDVMDSLTVSVINGTAPYVFEWADNESTDSIAYNLPLGVQYITVTDMSGCGSITDSVVIYKEGDYFITFDTTFTACADSIGSAQVVVTGGIAPFDFLWSNAETTDYIDSLWVDYYGITVTDIDGCQRIDTVKISDGSSIAYNTQVLRHIKCEGMATGSAIVTDTTGGTSPYSILWQNGETTFTAQTLSAGINSVKVFDQNGCVGLNRVTIKEDSILNIENFFYTDDISCDGNSNGSAEANVIGGDRPYSFEWSTGETVSEINDLAPAVYTVTVSDINGCEDIDSIEIVSDHIRMEIVSQTNVDCHGYNTGEVTIQGRGGYMAGYYFEWSTGDSTATIDSLIAGTYTVTISEELSNCIAVDSVIITEPEDFTRNFVTTQETDCNTTDGTMVLSITGGTRPFEYIWSNGVTDSVITNVGPEYFSVTITDANGCEIIDSARVKDNSPFAIESGNIGLVKCYNQPTGRLTVLSTDGVEPYNYSWSHDPSWDEATAGGLLGGKYSVTVTDADQCWRDLAFEELIEPDSIQIDLSITDSIDCHGQTGIVAAEIIGGNSVESYVWKYMGDSLEIENDTIFGAFAGMYSLYIHDIEDCFSDTVSITLTQPAPINVMANIKPTGCEDSLFTGRIEVTNIIGDFPPFKFKWYDSPDTLVFGVVDTDSLVRSELSNEQSYTFRVTDSTGCNTTEYFTVTPEHVVRFDTLIVMADCNYYTTEEIANEAPNGRIELSNIIGGVAPFKYYWNSETGVNISGGTTNAEYFGLQADSIILDIEGANMCTSRFKLGVDAQRYLTTKIYATDGISKFPIKKNICLNDSILLVSQSLDTLFNGDTMKNTVQVYKWQVPNGYNEGVIFSPTEYQTVVKPDSTTIFTFMRSNDGCTAPPINQVTISHFTEQLDASIYYKDALFGKNDPFELIGGEEIEVLPFPDTITTYYQDTIDDIWPANGFTSFIWNSYNTNMDRQGGEDHIVDSLLDGNTYNETGFVGLLHKPMKNIVYTVEGVTNNGCVDYDTITVKVIPDIFIPSAFSPNNDNINDIWEIPYMRLCPNAEVIIFNRWGVKLWTSDKDYIDNPWDGKNSNGKDLKIGTYYYVIKFNDAKGSPDMAGSVTIVR